MDLVCPAGGWLVLQVLDVLGQNLGLPPWVFRVTIALLAVGFLAALVLAWYHGEKGRQRVSGMEVLLLAGILVITGAAVAFVREDANPTPRDPVAAAGEAPSSPAARGETDPKPTLAVLPFENLSPDPDNAYFAAGVHEDVLTHLSRIRDLTVLARTSVLRYRDTEKSVGEIAGELGATAVLAGSVRRAGDQIRIVTQLVDPATEGQLWAETYNRRLELGNVLEVQTEIARRVALALEVRLSREEEVRMAARPTGSLAAYDLYTRGREAYNRGGDEENAEAVRL